MKDGQTEEKTAAISHPKTPFKYLGVKNKEDLVKRGIQITYVKNGEEKTIKIPGLYYRVCEEKSELPEIIVFCRDSEDGKIGYTLLVDGYGFRFTVKYYFERQPEDYFDKIGRKWRSSEHFYVKGNRLTLV